MWDRRVPRARPRLHDAQVRVPWRHPGHLLRLGLQFADGTIATNLGHHPLSFADVTEPTGPVLLERGGGGGGRRYDQKYWVWPLPPAGSLTFVCAWPARNIPESRHEIDADRIREAAGRARYVWS